MLTLGSSTQRAAGLLASAPSRPAIAFQEAIREASPLFVVEAPTSFGPQPFSFRDPGRNPVWRFFAHVLIRLLVIAPLPPQLQAAAVLFPVSVLWPLVRPAEASAGTPQKSGSREGAEPAAFPLSESQACVCGKVPEPTRAERIVSLTEPSQPKIAGRILPTQDNPAGMGGRLALGKGNILYSTTRSVFGVFGGDDPLGGVRIAALGQTAFVNTAPARIVVGDVPNLPLRSAEKFKLKYRVIPSNTKVDDAKLEFVLNEAVVETIEKVPLSDGRGEIPLLQGYTFQRQGDQLARPRLVVNAGTASEIKGMPGRWSLSTVVVKFAPHDQDVDATPAAMPGGDGVTADFPEVGVVATSEEWFKRFENLSPGEQGVMRQVTWEARDAPAVTHPGASLAQDGAFEATLDTGTKAGQARDVVAKIGEVVLGTTDPVLVEPGVATQVTITEGQSRTALPSDETSELILTVEAKDAANNLVADGTPVVWEMADGTDGFLIEAQEATADGKATAKYRAGGSPGPVTVRAHVGNGVGEFGAQQAPLGILLVAPVSRAYNDRSPLELTIQVTCAAGPVANAAPVTWFSSIGRVVPTQGLTDGVAKAQWEFAKVTYRPRVDFVVTIGKNRMQHRMAWSGAPGVTTAAALGTRAKGARALASAGSVAESGVPIASIAPMMIAGDLSADGTVPFELPDGSFEAVPVKASATYRVTGLTPGERVSVRLGTNQNPNLPPVAHYTAEQLEGGVVPDATGVHTAHATGSVSVEPGGYRGQGFRFGDGTGLISVPHDREFEFTGGFMVQSAVKVVAGSAGQTVIDKPGEYRLALVDVNGELHARFDVVTDAGEQQITSTRTVPADEWTLVTGRYEDGRLWIGVGASNEPHPLTGAPLRTTADIQIGPGFIGSLDEIRIYDLSRGALSAFAGGAQSISFTADATGTFETQIVSTGQLTDNQRVAAYYGLLAGEVAGPAADEPGLTDRSYGAVFTQTDTFWEDRAETETTDFGYVSSTLLGFMAKFGRGVFVGTGGSDEFDPAVLAGDLLGSIFLSPVSVVREFLNAADRAIRSQPNGGDALQLALGVVNVAAALMKGRMALLAKTATVAKALPTNSKAAGVMARLVSLEVKLAAGAEGVSKIKKLADMANLAYTTKQAVGFVLDFVGDQEQSVEHFNNVVENAEKDQEVTEELGTFPQTIPADEMRMFLRAAGTPLAEGAPAALSATSSNKWVQFAKETLEGVRTSRVLLVGAQLNQRAKAFAGNVKQYHGGRLKEIYNKIRDLDTRLGSNKGNIHRLMSDLVHPLENKRNGAMYVLRVAHAVSETTKVTFEVSKRVVSATGQVFHRSIDFITEGGVWHELKNWDWSKWGGFPPPKPSAFPYDPKAFWRASGQWNALRHTEKQFMTALMHPDMGPAAAKNLKFLFPQGLSGAGQQALRDHFVGLLKDPLLKKHMVRFGTTFEGDDLVRYEQTVKNVTAAIGDVIGFR